MKHTWKSWALKNGIKIFSTEHEGYKDQEDKILKAFGDCVLSMNARSYLENPSGIIQFSNRKILP